MRKAKHGEVVCGCCEWNPGNFGAFLPCMVAWLPIQDGVIGLKLNGIGEFRFVPASDGAMVLDDSPGDDPAAYLGLERVAYDDGKYAGRTCELSRKFASGKSERLNTRTGEWIPT